jgi:hypothetical protein
MIKPPSEERDALEITRVTGPTKSSKTKVLFMQARLYSFFKETLALFLSQLKHISFRIKPKH